MPHAERRSQPVQQHHAGGERESERQRGARGGVARTEVSTIRTGEPTGAVSFADPVDTVEGDHGTHTRRSTDGVKSIGSGVPSFSSVHPSFAPAGGPAGRSVTEFRSLEALQTQCQSCWVQVVNVETAMAQPQRRPDSSSLAEVLDRILDKGVVIDVWARVSVVGIELLTIEARVVVASVDTFLHYAEEIAKIEQATAEGDLEELEELEVEPRPESSPQSAE